uniref:Uncharacterized protein n=1 Tax=Rhizophora mucronata TaxID=61149 RepID=A0A2P2QT75_RHIMU
MECKRYRLYTNFWCCNVRQPVSNSVLCGTCWLDGKLLDLEKFLSSLAATEQ